MDSLLSLYRKAAQALTRDLLESLGQPIHAVVLFGSVARGTSFRDDSDIDLLILGDQAEKLRPRIAEMEFRRDAAAGYRTCLTSVTLDPEEALRLAQLGSPFLKEVVQDGIALYDDGWFARIREAVLAAGRAAAG